MRLVKMWNEMRSRKHHLRLVAERWFSSSRCSVHGARGPTLCSAYLVVGSFGQPREVQGVTCQRDFRCSEIPLVKRVDFSCSLRLSSTVLEYNSLFVGSMEKKENNNETLLCSTMPFPQSAK